MLGRLRQEEHEPKDSLGHRARSKSSMSSTQQDMISAMKQQDQRNPKMAGEMAQWVNVPALQGERSGFKP